MNLFDPDYRYQGIDTELRELAEQLHELRLEFEDELERLEILERKENALH